MGDIIGFITFEFIVFIITILIVLFGMYCLLKYSGLISRNQRMYLISYTATEIVFSLYHLMAKIIDLINPMYQETSWFFAIEIFYFDAIWIVNIVTLGFLTLDRFAEIYLNIRYEIYVSRKMTLLTIFVIWIVGIAIGITSISVSLILPNIDVILYECLGNLWIVLSSIVLLNAISVYLYIYKKYSDNQRKVSNVVNRNNLNSNNNDEHKIRGTGRRHIKKPKLFIPLFIIITYCIFVYIPDIVYIYKLKTMNNTYILDRVFVVLYLMNIISDVTIYIFLQRGIRLSLLKQWQRRNRSMTLRNPVSTVSSVSCTTR